MFLTTKHQPSKHQPASEQRRKQIEINEKKMVMSTKSNPPNINERNVWSEKFRRKGM